MSLDTRNPTFAGEEGPRAHPRSKREQIVKAALQVFLENGYAATSMNRVADAAGVIKATIYSHFKDKEQLFVAIIEEATIGKIAFDFNDKERIIAISPEEFMDEISNKFHTLEQDAEYHRFLRVVIGESERFPELAHLYVKTVIMRGMECASAYFEHHPELGLEDPQAAAHVIAGSFVSLVVWQKILGGCAIAPLEIGRVKNVLKALICDRTKLTRP
ncbi:MAG: TetR/AcrR family transcriptional regulator [Cyanobacteria bacterium SZAS LIN-2]|nr:TetR/AcrR family transcriptional regulator [Cyanobacteria bacterium SZAS LIN-2]